MNDALNNEQKEIRVFVSSTFIDLKEERDYITRRTFPRLAEYCRQRGILFTGVDLRWGITEEQSKEGRTIRMCLDEINKCHPFFINILGQRYGWVPSKNDLEKDTVLKENYKNLMENPLNEAISITEMEIIEGVFNRGSDVNAFFFLGDEKFYEERNLSLNIETEDIYKQEQLKKLKERITDSSFPVYENFKGKEELGQAVYNALIKAIEKKYPVNRELSESEKEQQKHESFAFSRKNYYLKNYELFKMLTNHTKERNEPLLIWGESGTGKSSLMANWATYYRDNYPEVRVIEHYIGASSQTEENIIEHLLMELQEYENLDAATKSSKTALKNTLIDVLKTKNEKIVVVIDALNQLEESARDLNWISGNLADNLMFIMSTTDEIFANTASRRGWSTYRLETLNKDEIRTIIKEYLSIHGKELNSNTVDKVVENKEYFAKFNWLERLILKMEYGEYSGHLGNPMYLKIFLDELILYATNSNIDEKIEAYLDSTNIEKLLDKVFDRLEYDFGSKVVSFLLGHIYVSKNGLSEQELRLLGASYQIPYITLVECLNNLASHLINKEDGLDFFHNYIRNVVSKRYVKEDKTEKLFRENIVSCFMKLDVYHDNLSDRVLEEVPYQLYMLDDNKALRDFLSDKNVFLQLSKQQPYTLFKYMRKLMEGEISFIEEFFDSIDTDGSSRENFSDFLLRNRYYRAAEKLYKAIFQTLIKQASKDVVYQSTIIKKILRTLLLQDKFDETLEYAKFDVRINVLHSGKHSLGTINALNNFSHILLHLKKYNKAVNLFRICFERKKELLTADSIELMNAEEKIYVAASFDTNIDNQKTYLTGKISKTDRFLKNYSKDIRVIKLREIIEQKRKITGEISTEVGKSYILLGDFYMLHKNNYEADLCYNKALHCFMEIYGKGHLVVSDIHIKLKNYKEAWIVRQNQLGLNHPETLKALELYRQSLDTESGFKDSLIGSFLKYIKGKKSIPALENVDSLIEIPRDLRRINKRLNYKYFIPIHTLYLMAFLAFMSLVMPLKWMPAGRVIFVIQLLVLGYINGRNKNFFSLIDIALFIVLPELLMEFVINRSNALISYFSYTTVMVWLQEFNFSAATWLGLNFINTDPELIVSLVKPGKSFLSIGITRYLIFSVMFLLALLDLKYETTKRDLAKKILYGGQN